MPITPPYKTVLYQVCSFLVNKRLLAEGRGLNNPFAIPLQEFERAIHEAPGGELADKLKYFSGELDFLTKESLDGSTPIFKIHNPEIIGLENIVESYANNLEITVQYGREAVQQYIQKLEEGDAIMQAGEHSGIVTVDPNIRSSAIHIKRGTDEMKITLSRGKNIRANICLLLFGYPATFRSSAPGSQTVKMTDQVDHEDYMPGAEVEFSVLADLILRQGDHSANLPSEADPFKTIREAVNDLNERAQEELGVPLFERTPETIKVSAPLE